MIIGIDPGKKGAIAMLSTDGELLEVLPMPETDESLSKHLSAMARMNNTQIWVERVPKYAGKNQSGSSVATLFANYRYIVGFLEGQGVTVHQVVPQSWQKPYRLATDRWQVLSYSQRKATLHECATSRFNRTKKELPRWAADAALIALHGHKVRTETKP
jgi:hypothetical protein